MPRWSEKERGRRRQVLFEQQMERAERLRSEKRRRQVHSYAAYLERTRASAGRSRNAECREQQTRPSIVRAALTIQRWWRQSGALGQKVVTYRQFSGSVDAMRQVSFDEATATMKSSQRVKATDDLLTAIWRMSLVHNGRAGWSSRAFTSAYLFVAHGAAVFTGADAALDARLESAARSMLAIFALLRATSGRTRMRSALVEAFCCACAAYFTCFSTWRRQDASFMLRRFEAHYVELESFRAQIVAQSPDRRMAVDPAVYIAQAESEQRRLLLQIARLASRSHASRLARRVSGPRADALLTCLSSRGTTEQPQAPQRADQVKQELEHRSESQARSNQHLADALANEYLAHELVLDPDFTLKEEEEGSNNILTNFKTEARRAFWDIFVASVETGDAAAMIPALVSDIGEQLTQLAPSSKALASDISSALNPDAIVEQIADGAFNARALLSFIADRLGMLCAPARDIDVRQLKEAIQALPDGSSSPRQLVPLFESIMRLLRVTRVDLANAHLALLRPHLLPVAVEREREAFAKHIERGDWSLRHTRAWLGRSSGTECQAWVFSAIAALLLPDGEEALSALPETLHLDAERLSRASGDLQRMINVAIICMSARTTLIVSAAGAAVLGRAAVAALARSKEARGMGPALEAFIAALPNAPPSEATMRFFQHAARAAQAGSPVHGVLTRSVRSIVAQALAGRLPSTETLVRAGLMPIREQLLALLEALSRFASHHWDVHQDNYRQLMQV